MSEGRHPHGGVEDVVMVWMDTRTEEERGEPRVYPDDGTLREFNEWLLTNRIYSVWRSGGHSGGGSYLAYYSPEDAERIRAWFCDHDIQEPVDA